ncbi:class I SAM-dependent methyltransferase [Streptomyces sp. NPDC048717]|uniref:class I SAM-dependent methyltransferase n=1 Tax=Streptomyces sp. NPDC048717 TaxID=3154928 RepID=UPI00343E548A
MSQDSAAALTAPTRLEDVKGWFWAVDQLLFDWFLKKQNGDPDTRGDLLEMGAYMGKSAILIGSYLQPGERFTVCDLFDAPAPDASNLVEMKTSYSTLTRRAFEANYLAFHDELPTIVMAPTSVVTDEVKADSCRFIHIDASHLYEHVHGDIAASRAVATEGAVVVFDDYRSEHCPGVAAAVWGAVARDGLQVICVTGSKLYATWSDAEPLREEMLAWLATREDLWHGVEEVAGAPLIRIGGKRAIAPALPQSRYKAPEPAPAPVAPKPTPAPAPKPAPKPAVAAARRPQSKVRKLAKDVLPPIVTRAIVAQRRSR